MKRERMYKMREKLVEIEGRYWISTAIDNGMALYLKTKDAAKEHYFRSCGLSIRPVTKYII